MAVSAERVANYLWSNPLSKNYSGESSAVGNVLPSPTLSCAKQMPLIRCPGIIRLRRASPAAEEARAFCCGQCAM